MIANIAQKLLNDRGELFEGMYSLEDVRFAAEVVNGLPVQYIQYNWDNGRLQVDQFYSYTPEEWDTFDLLPNLQYVKVYGRKVSWNELEGYIKNKIQPEGAAFSR